MSAIERARTAPMTHRERWDALLEELQAAGIDAKRVDARAYPGGTSRSITIWFDRGTIEIADTWWRKNADKWTGWQVHLSGRDGFVKWSSDQTKVRARVLAYVQDALTGHGPKLPR